MDRDMMEVLSEMGFLYEGYYATPEAEGLEREEEIPLPPCVAPFGKAMRAASRIMYTMEQAGQTDHSAYDVARSAVERGLELLTASALEIFLSIFGDSPYGMRPMDDGYEECPYGGILDGILAATGENAGHRVIPTMPGGLYAALDPQGGIVFGTGRDIVESGDPGPRTGRIRTHYDKPPGSTEIH